MTQTPTENKDATQGGTAGLDPTFRETKGGGDYYGHRGPVLSGDDPFGDRAVQQETATDFPAASDDGPLRAADSGSAQVERESEDQPSPTPFPLLSASCVTASAAGS